MRQGVSAMGQGLFLFAKECISDLVDSEMAILSRACLFIYPFLQQMLACEEKQDKLINE